MSDILHSIADMLGQKEGGEQQEIGNMEKSADDFQHDVNDGAESGADDSGDVQLGTMIPPLQQQLELQKKATGVDNAFDDKQSDELGDIKKLSGIKAVISAQEV